MTHTQTLHDLQHPFLANLDKRMLIDGQWVQAASGQSFETINPSTGKVLARIAQGDSEDVDRAVSAARRAFEGPWSKLKPFDRAAMLLRLADLIDTHFDELCWLDSLDMGMPISMSSRNKFRVVSLLRYYAGMATSIHGETLSPSIPGEFFACTVKEPVGVVGAIIPWNSPLTGSIWKVAPALAAGCTIILKPAEQASLTPLRFGELIHEAGVPAGVVNIITGFGHSVGAALAAHRGVDKIAFTGSTDTGRKIIEASAGNIKRISLELGGKSPNIVFADADINSAVPGAAMAIFANSGQICSAGSRLLVERPIYEEFVQRVAEFGKTLRVGNSLRQETQIGPLVSKQQLNRVSEYITIGRDEGAKTVTGGNRLTNLEMDQGFFVAPTVFSNVTNDMRIAREEIFGPVLVAIPFDNVDEVVRLGNQSDFGLGSGVWTRDINKAHRVAKSLRSGTVWINCYQAMDPCVPFGGYKLSGYGRESGIQHIDEYLNVKSIWIRTE